MGDLHRIDHPKSITTVLQRDLEYAAVHTLEGFGGVGLPASRRNGEPGRYVDLHLGRKLREVLLGTFQP